MGEEFFNTDFYEDLRTRNAKGTVSYHRELHDDVVLFDRAGTVYAVRSERGKIREGDNMSRFMLADEWRYLRENSLKFACERVIVDTKLGGMVVFSNMAASMRIMIGVIFHTDRAAFIRQYPMRATSLICISPRMSAMSTRKSVSEEEEGIAKETADLAFRAFMTAGIKNRLLRSPAEATGYVIDRACHIAELMGCRIDCRSARSSLPLLQDFNVDAYVVLTTCLMMFVWNHCPDHSLQMKIADIEGRLFPILRCEPDLAEKPIFANRRYCSGALHLCECISSYRRFLFECSEREDSDGPHLRVCFSPAIRPIEKLGVKEPIKKLDYGDLQK